MANLSAGEPIECGGGRFLRGTLTSDAEFDNRKSQLGRAIETRLYATEALSGALDIESFR